ncbi:MAG: hypothetical protein AAF402_05135 [Pseudomonadota bacterium]
MNVSKRKVLKVMAGVSPMYALPANWSKPVIDSVVLPLHAQSTLPDETTTPAPSEVTSISSAQSGACGSSRPSEFYRLEINDDNAPGGPFPVTITGPIPDPGLAMNFVRITAGQNANGPFIVVERSGSTASDSNPCGGPIDTSVSLNSDVFGINGTPRTLSYDLTRVTNPVTRITAENFQAV